MQRSWLALGLAWEMACASTPAAPVEVEPPAKTEAAPRKPSGRAELERAKALAREEKTTEAEAAAKRAIEADPSLEDAHLLLVSLCELRGDGACATEAVNRGLEAVPRSATLKHAKGMGELEGGDAKKAAGTLTEADGLAAGKNPEIAADLAYALIFAEKLTEAEEVAKRAMRLAPKAFAPAYTHAEALLRLGRAKEAAPELEAAASFEDADLPTVKRRLGDALVLSGEVERGIEVYRAVEKLADAPDLQVAIAGACLKVEQAACAVEAMQKAKNMAPNDERITALLAEAERRAKAKKKGKK